MGKRLFDIICSSAGLIVLSPLFLVLAVVIRLDSAGPAFFRQERIGRNFRPFMIYKFRTMQAGSDRQGAPITVAGDGRVTRVGRSLRRYKLDELPQLINVLRGDMSLVGPRPEIRKYVELYRPAYEVLLTVRPGITDSASLEFSDEETVLSRSGDWEEDYRARILPEKIALSRRYVERQSLASDVKIILKTILRASGLNGCSESRPLFR